MPCGLGGNHRSGMQWFCIRDLIGLSTSGPNGAVRDMSSLSTLCSIISNKHVSCSL